MALVTTDAIVLHAFDYSETSRILRVATREVGVQSVLARGARRSRTRFASSLDLFVEGVAELYLKDGRELQTLGAFDITEQRAELGKDLGRFTSASAVAELVLRFGTDDASPTLYDALGEALDDIAAAPPEQAREAGLAGVWRLVAELGFAPSLATCSSCHAPVPDHAELSFSHGAGGVLCVSCAPSYATRRVLPPEARACIASWSGAGRVGTLDLASARAHQRLVREFLQEHLAEGRALNAFDVWESGRWSAP
jgi:DNA repair protein RecO (recombination protein O)